MCMGCRSAIGSLLCIVLIAVPRPADGQDMAVTTDRWTAAAMSFVQAMEAGEFQQAAALVSPPLAVGPMSASQLQTIWMQLTAQLGSLRELRPLRLAEQGEHRLVELFARFQEQELVLLVPVDGDVRILGFRLLPASDAPYGTPAYADTASFSEQELTIGSPPWTLGATLSLPAGAGPFPAIVLVHGSGPNDRDQTVGPNRPFRDLAWGLASAGIAVLRYDKRTRTHGHRLDPLTLTLDGEVIDDAVAAMELLRTRDDIDPDQVFVLGLSLGATLAPVIAQRDGRAAGAILLAALARPFGQVLEDQLRYLKPLQAKTPQDSAQFRDHFARLAALEAGTLPDTAMVLGMPAGYIRELDALRVTEVAGRIRTPLLVLQGERDYQITMADFELWRQALAEHPDALLRSYPALDHLFMAGEGLSKPEDFFATQRNVDPAVLRDVIQWVRRVAGPVNNAGATGF